MRSQTIDAPSKTAQSLKRAMRSNGVFSALSGVIFLVAAGPLAAFMGLPSPIVLVILAVILIAYAVALFQVTSRPLVDRRFGVTAVALDVGWVIASAAILITGWPELTVSGKWTVGLLAEAVGVFAIWQALALRRSQK